MRNLPLASLLLAAAATAQNHIVSYPQDTLTMSSGNIVPLGSLPASNFEEGRWQALIPNTHLPTTQCVIAGFSAISQTYAGVLNYRSLRVTMSPTTATSLVTTFATNLVLPQMVINQTNFNVTYVGTFQWTYIPFDMPYVHDGRSNVVFEIRKEVTSIAAGIATMATLGNAPRTELPSSVYAFGPVSSGAANAVTSSFSVQTPLQIRLHVARTPTIFLDSARGTTNEFPIGGSMDLACDASVGSRWIGLVDGAFSPRFAVPGLLGTGMVLPAIILGPRTITVTPDRLTLGIPPNPALVGVALSWQGVVIEAALAGVYFTNGANCIIRS